MNPQLPRVMSRLPLPHHCWWCFPQVSGGSRVSVSETPTSVCSDWKHFQSVPLLPSVSQALVPCSCAGTAPHPAVPSALCTGHASQQLPCPHLAFLTSCGKLYPSNPPPFKPAFHASNLGPPWERAVCPTSVLTSFFSVWVADLARGQLGRMAVPKVVPGSGTWWVGLCLLGWGSVGSWGLC